MSVYKESVHRDVYALFFNKLNYRIMSNRTFAQEAILHRINEKAVGGILNEDHWEHIDHNAYVDCCVLNGVNTAN